MQTEFRQLWEVKIERKSFGFITKITPSALLIGVLALQACGSKSNEKTNNPTQIDASVLVQDSQLTSGIVNASHGDVVAAAADQGTSSSMLGLSLSDSDDDDSTVTKTCAASSDGKSAIVSISSNVNRTRTKSSGGGRVVITSTRTGSSATTRTWSRADGTAVACNNSGAGANVDFKNPDGLKLDISFERSRNDSMTYTGPKLTRTSSKSFKSSGSRIVTWAASDSSADGTTYARNKSVIIKDVNQSLTMTNKNGENFAATLNINTTEGQPLVVKVERNASSNAVVSKTFVSGEVVARKDSDSTMTTTYSNLKLDFSDSSCAISSGSAQIVIKDSAGTVLKTLTLGVDSSGDSTLKDSGGEDVEGFSLDACDSEDLKL